MKLAGKVALVTGSAQGIGKAIAVAMAKEGANIVISDINIDLAKATAAEIEKMGVKTLALQFNVADLSQTEAAIKSISETFGKLDILVNNAGITRDGLLLRMKKEDWDLVISVNLTGVFNLCKVVTPVMMKARSGKIINISSIVGEMGNAGQMNYSASKAGVIGMTKTLAKEVGSRNIQVNAIAPGFIDTDMTKKLSDEVKNAMMAQIPLGKLGQPEDVAAAAVFLASPDADYVTGQVLSVNGGMYM
jgi:3-oxoacyl-[acyl-carrier protein] reductase